MKDRVSVRAMVIAAMTVLVLGAAGGVGWAESRWSEASPHVDRTATDTWAEFLAWLEQNKEIIELADAVIRVEVNSTDGDAGFQIELDGDGWRTAEVFAPNGDRVLRVVASSGVRNIGGGTELFLESAEPPYEDLDDMQSLLDLLPEGDYLFLARTTDAAWAVAETELTHTIPAGPEIVTPVPGDGEECATDVPANMAVIEWDPVTTTIQGDPDVEVVEYQIIVSDEETGLEFSMFVEAETTEIVIPPEFLEPETEYKFEVLAIEDSDNQTITESCFVTAA